MGIRQFVITRTFEAGMAVQKVRSMLARTEAGECNIISGGIHYVTIEIIGVKNPLWMSWIEDQLADFV